MMDVASIHEFDQSLKILRRSKLIKTREYMDMVLAIERFYQDARLSSLTCKDPNQLVQQHEDGQFFNILRGMLLEVTKSSGLKQREDLRKVYHWYKLNKDVLHCQPHFQSVSKPPNQPPQLKFSPDVIKHYSIPLPKRKTKHVGFKDDISTTVSVSTNTGSEPKHSTKSVAQRPMTAPAGLSRPKVENTLPKSWKGQQYLMSDSGLTISYINKHLTPQKYMAALERPASALAVVRQTQKPLIDERNFLDGYSEVSSLSSRSMSPKGSLVSITVDNNAADLHSTSLDKKNKEDSDLSDTDDDSIDVKTQGAKSEGVPEGVVVSEDGKDNSVPAPSMVSPVTQFDFADEESFGGALPPDKRHFPKKMIEVNIPVPGEETSSIATTSQSNLQKWQEFQQSQASLHSNGLQPHPLGGSFQSEGILIEMPELNTEQVISEYANDKGLADVQVNVNPLAPSCLKDFYQTTEKFSPQVCQKRPASTTTGKLSSGMTPFMDGDKEPQKIYVPDELAADIKIRNALNKELSGPLKVPVESIVDLAGRVGDQMTIERESQLNVDELPYGQKQPTVSIPLPRPHTAPGFHHRPESRGTMSPPNSARSSLDSLRSATAADALLFIPSSSSHYDVHFRRKERPVTALGIPHALRLLPVQPDSTRYRNRSKSATPRSLRSAGSTSAGSRPRTASSLPVKEIVSLKPRSHRVKVPGAASHSTTTIHPLTISSMMAVRHLGGKSSNFREYISSQYSPRNIFEEFEEEIPDDLPPNMEFLTISGPVSLHGSKAEEKRSTSDVDDVSSMRLSIAGSPQPDLQQKWSSPHDSIEGLVQLGRSISEMGGELTNSLPGSSDRAFSPEPADLSDWEGSDKDSILLGESANDPQTPEGLVLREKDGQQKHENIDSITDDNVVIETEAVKHGQLDCAEDLDNLKDENVDVGKNNELEDAASWEDTNEFGYEGGTRDDAEEIGDHKEIAVVGIQDDEQAEGNEDQNLDLEENAGDEKVTESKQPHKEVEGI